MKKIIANTNKDVIFVEDVIRRSMVGKIVVACDTTNRVPTHILVCDRVSNEIGFRSIGAHLYILPHNNHDLELQCPSGTKKGAMYAAIESGWELMLFDSVYELMEYIVDNQRQQWESESLKKVVKDNENIPDQSKVEMDKFLNKQIPIGVSVMPHDWETDKQNEGC